MMALMTMPAFVMMTTLTFCLPDDESERAFW